MNHVFVGGPPRSGTTLLELVLSAHPEIIITPETSSIQKLVQRRWPVGSLLTPGRAAVVREVMRSDAKLGSWPGFDREAFLASRAIRAGVRLADVLDALFVAYARAHGRQPRWYGNKKGLYADRWGARVKRMFPDAKFVFIVRDPRDVVPSMLANLGRTSVREASVHIARLHVHMDRLQRRFPTDVEIIRYEDLVLNPPEACARVCDFLGVRPSRRMLDFHEDNAAGDRLLGATKAIHPHTRGSFNPDLVGRWRRDRPLRTVDLRQVERTTGAFMARFGYVPVTSSGQSTLHRVIRYGRVRLAMLRRILGGLRGAYPWTGTWRA